MCMKGPSYWTCAQDIRFTRVPQAWFLSAAIFRSLRPTCAHVPLVFIGGTDAPLWQPTTCGCAKPSERCRFKRQSLDSIYSSQPHSLNEQIYPKPAVAARQCGSTLMWYLAPKTCWSRFAHLGFIVNAGRVRRVCVCRPMARVVGRSKARLKNKFVWIIAWDQDHYNLREPQNWQTRNFGNPGQVP